MLASKKLPSLHYSPFGQVDQDEDGDYYAHCYSGPINEMLGAGDSMKQNPLAVNQNDTRNGAVESEQITNQLDKLARVLVVSSVLLSLSA